MIDFLAKSDFFELLPTSFLQTCLMVLISTVLAYLVGLPLGILLYVTGKNGLIKNKVINSIAGFIVNILRSIPCLLLIVLLMPLTRLILKYGTGHWYSIIIPLFFASFKALIAFLLLSFCRIILLFRNFLFADKLLKS